MNLQKKSKYLSYILRHNPNDVGLTLSEGGWVSVEKLLAAIKFTQEELDEIVATDNKKRYSYDGKGNIRANQGHSIEVDMQFSEVMPPDILYHGTSSRALVDICDSGIKKMSRQHVHLSSDFATASKVGSRHGISVVLKINARKMHAEGCKFYCSDNGVWLTDFVDPKYFL